MTTGRTGTLPGTQTKKQKEIDDAAAVYVRHRDKRLAELKKETESHDKLVQVMVKHKLDVYTDEESGRTITLKEGKTKAKVADQKDAD